MVDSTVVWSWYAVVEEGSVSIDGVVTSSVCSVDGVSWDVSLSSD